MLETTVPLRVGSPALRRAGFAALLVAALGMSAFALARIGIGDVTDALVSVRPTWALLAFALMAASMVLRSEAWYAVLGPALPQRTVSRADVSRATMIGVFMSAILPGRVGEAGRAIVLSRRLGRVSGHLPVVVGTLFSQTLLNVLGLFAVAAIAFASTPALQAHAGAMTLVAVVPAVLLVLVILGPSLVERTSPRSPMLRKAASAAALRLSELRRGLLVFRRVSATSHALSAQLAAWALQLLSVYALLVAFRLQDQAGIAAAAAVLTAVNVTGIVPVTPSNVGIFQAACVLVLAAWGIGTDTALAYGILLQGIEVAVALALGLPALAGEHTSFRDIRRRAENLPETPPLAGSRAG
jgi:phosphatidyl-myo-inositol alpha-mannosyltransferase